MGAITKFPEKAQQLIAELLEEYPDVQAAVLLVDYDPKLKNADLSGVFLKAQNDGFGEIKRFHSMCLHGASAVNARVMGDLVELYRTTTSKTEKETENDS